MLELIHAFLDNARYHHAKLVQTGWPSRGAGSCCISSRPTAPHLNPIERLWGVMHKHMTHNMCYATCKEFAHTTLGFLSGNVRFS